MHEYHGNGIPEHTEYTNEPRPAEQNRFFCSIIEAWGGQWWLAVGAIQIE